MIRKMLGALLLTLGFGVIFAASAFAVQSVWIAVLGWASALGLAVLITAGLRMAFD